MWKMYKRDASVRPKWQCCFWECFARQVKSGDRIYSFKVSNFSCLQRLSQKSMPFDHLLDFSRPLSPVSIQLQQPAHPDSAVKQFLRSLLVSLNEPLSGPLINHAVGSLMQREWSS